MSFTGIKSLQALETLYSAEQSAKTNALAREVQILQWGQMWYIQITLQAMKNKSEGMSTIKLRIF